MSRRFVRILKVDDADKGGRMRVYQAAPDDIVTLTYEVVLPEKVHDPDARRVTTYAALVLATRAELDWLREQLNSVADRWKEDS